MTRGTTRRQVLAALAAIGVAGCATRRGTQPRVVIVGGGFGGASCARALRDADPNIDITLVEPNRRYLACPLSNLVIGGWRRLEQQAFSYAALEARGIRVLATRATDVDPVTKRVTMATGGVLDYDRLVMSPGVDLDFKGLPGYDAVAAQRMPHAWSAGAQTLLLRRQLEAMPEGGTFAIVAPDNPYRCPPGPYERASVVAHYLSEAKPRSKVLILDAKDRFSKQSLFLADWRQRYGDQVTWQGRSDGARVVRVNADAGLVETEFDTVRADVTNVIPPQRAAGIAARAGVTDASGWCPVDAASFASTQQNDIHVLGDAAIANAMPKSAFSAQAQGRLVAAQILLFFNGLPPVSTKLVNTCYSYLAPDSAVSIADVFRAEGQRWLAVEGAGGVSALSATREDRRGEADAALRWFNTATAGAFG
ncbi:MAG: NAD(P)/FAD-dependent oxidoreductase [Pseudomonadota bacterium]